MDIIGDAVSDETGEPFKVIIENQLEETDHRHLGQILIDVAAYGARVAVWISASARPEHAKAVQWLNDESSVDAYLFDVEVIRIENSRPAPILTRIVGPSELSKKAKAEKQANQADKQRIFGFWSTVLPSVASARSHLGVWQGRSPGQSVHVWQTVPNSAGRIGWQIWVTAHGSWLCLRVDAKTDEEAVHLWNQLLLRRPEIDQTFGPGLIWDPLDEPDHEGVNREAGGLGAVCVAGDQHR